MNELPYELIIEIFEKIDLTDYITFISLSKVNKKFNYVYKKYFEEIVKDKNKKYIPLTFLFSSNIGLSLSLNCYNNNFTINVSFNVPIKTKSIQPKPYYSFTKEVVYIFDKLNKRYFFESYYKSLYKKIKLNS